MTSTRVAAIDCGTNTVRLLIAERGGADGLVESVRLMRAVRLGEDLDRTGVIGAAALERTASALRSYAELIDRHRVEAVAMVATSASRDARNGAEFVAMVQDVLGITPRIISGEEEARLSFQGAVLGLPAADRMVVDIGGGSTEFVVGDTTVRSAVSVDIGSVRLTERHLATDPPTADQLSAARADVRHALSKVRASAPTSQGLSLIAVAGTATTIVAMALGLPAYESSAIHQQEIPSSEVLGICADLMRAPRAERESIPVMHPGRVDVIAAGALILAEIIAEFRFASVIASETDILDGLALQLLGG